MWSQPLARPIRVNLELTLGGEERDGGTTGTGTTGSTNAVNIVLRVVGVVIVQHMGNVADIFIYRLASFDVIGATLFLVT